ncbi:uncharacterized protein LOC113040593 [Carassius auratus]|uniref:ribonuclease H n=1 Tax=Carassius auratus TaxID=7957 RepID=A0A6P6J3I2_CARAU|nr:uncharacterized protein LOC113040593 [Carassius auratus]
MLEPKVAQIQTQIEPCPKPNVDFSQSALDSAERTQLETLIYKYSDVFSANEYDYGRTDLVKHTIRTGDAQPIRQRAYRTSPHVRAEIDRQVQQLLSNDVIEESCSPWASPVVLVKKKDGSYRFYSYPLPRASDGLDSLAGARWFSTMDLSSGYWQVELDPKDKEKTAFNTGSALYHFKVMPMGLTNAPPTFQRLMELVLRGLHWKVCLVYLDDVLVFSQTFSEHLNSLEEVFSRFRSAGLKLKVNKCHFARSEVSYLGHVVSSQGLLPDEKNLNKVRSWPTPRTVTEVRAFVGLCSYYRRFVRSFAVVATPLHALTQKGAVFNWSSDCEEAFRSLKQALTSPPIVAHPIFTQPFLLYTDASHDCVGSVHAQMQDGKERVIAYASHALTPSEKRWSTYDRELWAVVCPVLPPLLMKGPRYSQFMQNDHFKELPLTSLSYLLLLSGIGIEKTRTSPYHAQCDGMVERLNQTLKDQLAKYICESGGEWDKYLPQVELAYNSSIHSSTGFSPFFLAHGREPRLPADIILNYSPAVTSYTPGTPAGYAHDVTMRLSYAFKDAAVRSTAAKVNQKWQYDKKTFFHPHKPGDIVFLDDPAQKQNKLAPKWKGPYKILRRMDKDNCPGVTYEITDPRNPQSRRWVVHHNRLKPYRGPWELPATPSSGCDPPVFGSAEAPSLVPLTALSGALPFRPSTPPYVPNQTIQQTTTNAKTERSNPTALLTEPESVPSPSVPASMAPERAILPSADTPQLSRSGRAVKKPEKFKDFVC